ncbi:Metallo-beta-lactamase superfamily [Chryseobacterium nakagawai]|nr:MBL fold metallo-hydrolase [Chryseobacterium nakagawai]VEH19857.1 Metallo-beta-lactamase superfamily [Chryseobacterium nakagawai]
MNTFKSLILLIVYLPCMFACKSKTDTLYTKLSENIYEINNQYFYDEKVHTYLIVLKDKLLLFDIPAYSEDLETFITSFKKPVYAILSHGSCGIEDGTKWQSRINLKVYAHSKDENHPWLKMKPDFFFSEIPFFADNIEVIYTPGHSRGAICLLEKKSKSLFTGDTVYGDKTGNIKDFRKESYAEYENLNDRLSSCKKLLKYDFENIYPFHYEMIKKTAKERLQIYLNIK